MTRQHADQKRCRRCGKMLPINEFHKNGLAPNGRQRYHSECRDCKSEIKYGHPVRTGIPSPCTDCEHLAHCRSIIWTLTPLPCQNGAKPPRSTGWIERVDIMETVV